MNKSRRDANGLNKRERSILKAIQEGIIDNGYPPSVRELCKKVGLSSTATVQGYLNTLEERGYISKENQKGRTLRLLKDYKGEVIIAEQTSIKQPDKEYYSSREMVSVPVIGKITAGQPILDGDYILVKKQNVAQNGQIVVALIDDSATVKTFYKEKDHIRLQPENSSMDPILVPDCQILGRVAGVFRKM